MPELTLQLGDRTIPIRWLEDREPTPQELEDIERQVRQQYGLPAPQPVAETPGAVQGAVQGGVGEFDYRHLEGLTKALGFTPSKNPTGFRGKDKNGQPIYGGHNPGSMHYKGLALDVQVGGKSRAEVQDFIRRVQSLGIHVLDERQDPRKKDPSRVWGGPHLHLSIRDQNAMRQKFTPQALEALAAELAQPKPQPSNTRKQQLPSALRGAMAGSLGVQPPAPKQAKGQTVFDQLLKPNQRPDWVKPFDQIRAQNTTPQPRTGMDLRVAMERVDQQLAGRITPDKRAVIERFLEGVGGQYNVSHEAIQYVLKAAGKGDYLALADTRRVAHLLPFHMADLIVARRNGQAKVPSKEPGGEFTLRVANRIAARLLGVPANKLTNKMLGEVAKSVPLPKPRGGVYELNPVDQMIADSVPDDGLGIYLKSLPAAFQVFPSLLQDVGGQITGRERGDVLKDPSIKQDAVGQIGTGVFGVAKYFTPGGQIAAGADFLGVTQRTREVGPVKAGKEFAQGMLQSANVLEPNLPVGERIARGLNLLLLGLGATHAGVKAYQTGQKLPTIWEMSDRLQVSKTEAYMLLKSAEEQFKAETGARLPQPNAAVEGTIRNHQDLALKLEQAFTLPREQAEAVAMLADVRAQAWAAKHGRPVEEWFTSRLAGVERGGTPARDALYQPVPVDVARAIDMPVSLPQDPKFIRAVNNTPGARMDADGLRLGVIRFNDPEQSGGTALRTGVFYLPEGSPRTRDYRGGNQLGYGGSERVVGETLVKNPLVVDGATGGKAPERAYDQLRGKDAYQKLLTDARSIFLTAKNTQRMNLDYQVVDKVREYLERHGGDPDLADEIVYHSTKGNTLVFALTEHVVAHAVRSAGYDSVLGLSKKGGQPTISELFDVRESITPTAHGNWEIHPEFRALINQDMLRQGEKGSVEFLENGRALIRALESPDVSTAVHELGHVFRRDLEGPTLGRVEKWAGVKDGQWTPQAEEKFARAFERYLRTGKAPTAQLKSVFEQFKQWLTAVYQRVRGSAIDVPMGPVRQAFDELLTVPETRAKKPGLTEKLVSPEHAQTVASLAKGEWEEATPQQVADAILNNRASETLTQYTPEELSEMFLFKVRDRDVFFAAKPIEVHEITGKPALDLVAGVNNERGQPGIATPFFFLKGIDFWLEMGGPKVADLTLDCWDVGGFLPDRYGRFGFEIYQRFEYDLSYGEPSEALKSAWRQDSWKDGDPYPGVVYMKYEGPTEPGVIRENYLRTGTVDGRGSGVDRPVPDTGLHSGHGARDRDPGDGQVPGEGQGRRLPAERVGDNPDRGPQGLLADPHPADSQQFAKKDLDSFSQAYRDLHLFSDEELAGMGIDPHAVRQVEPLPEPGTEPFTPEEKARLQDALQPSLDLGEDARRESLDRVRQRLTEYGAKNVLVSREQYQAALDELRRGLGRTQMGVDPQLLAHALKVAVFHAEAGVRSFTQFVGYMAQDLGQDAVDKLRDHLPDIWDRARLKANKYAGPKTPHPGAVGPPAGFRDLTAKYTNVLRNLEQSKQNADSSSIDLYTHRAASLENDLLMNVYSGYRQAGQSMANATRQWVATLVNSHMRIASTPDELVRALTDKFELSKQQVQDLKPNISEWADIQHTMFELIKDAPVLFDDGQGQSAYRPLTKSEFQSALFADNPLDPTLKDLLGSLKPDALQAFESLRSKLADKTESIENLMFQGTEGQFMAKAIATYKSLMLFGLKSPINNALSNLLNVAALSVSRTPRVLTDMLLGTKTGTRTVVGYQDPLKALGQGLNAKVTREVWDVMRGLESQSSKYDISRLPGTLDTSTLSGKLSGVAKHIAEMGIRLAGAGDKPFRALAYNRAIDELAHLAARSEGLKKGQKAYVDRVKSLVESPTDLMVVEAQMQADYAVLDSKNRLAESITRGKSELKRGGLGSRMLGYGSEFILPFVKIPLNAAGRALEFAGGGLLEGMWQLADYRFNARPRAERAFREVPWSEVFSKEFSREAWSMMPPHLQRQIANNMGNGLTGIGLIVLGYVGYKAGWLRPLADDEPSDWNAQQATGHIPGALHVNGYDIDLRSSIVGRVMAVGATIAAYGDGELQDAEGNSSLSDLGSRIVKSVSDNPLAQGTNVVGKMVDKPIGGLVDYMAQQAGGALTPAFVRELSRATSPQNPVIEDQQGFGREVLDRFKSGIPILRSQLPGKTDVFGQPDAKGYWANVFGATRNKQNPVADELSRLKIPISRPGQSKKNTRKYGDERLGVGDERYDRNAGDYAERVAFVGQRVYQELSSILQDPTYPSMPDGEKREWLKQLVGEIREQASAELDDLRLTLGRAGASAQVRDLLGTRGGK